MTTQAPTEKVVLLRHGWKGKVQKWNPSKGEWEFVSFDVSQMHEAELHAHFGGARVEWESA